MSRFFIDKSVLSYRIRARAEDRNWRGPFAEVAELVDALGSGPSGGNTVGVRVPSSAPASLQQDSNRFSKARTSNPLDVQDRKSTRLNSSHLGISYAVFCLKKKN